MRKFIVGAAAVALSLGIASPALATQPQTVIQPLVECVTPTPHGFWATFTYTANGSDFIAAKMGSSSANRLTVGGTDLEFTSGNGQQPWIEEFVSGTRQYSFDVWSPSNEGATWKVNNNVATATKDSDKCGVGPAGPQGETGPMGPQGPQGKPGERGLPGANGTAGEPGAPGMNGAPGPQGPQGPQGVQGPMGPLGPQGPEGDQGKQGIPGLPGLSPIVTQLHNGVAITSLGYLTRNGEVVYFFGHPVVIPTGFAFVANGEDGKDGKDGHNGSNGNDGTNGVDGKDGVNGTDGSKGDTGNTGDTGSTGVAGTNGVTTTVFVRTPIRIETRWIGNTVRTLSIFPPKGAKVMSVKATLRGKSMKVNGRKITVDLRNKPISNQNVNITVKWRKNGKVSTHRYCRNLSVQFEQVAIVG
jgi:hypothetical protein